MTKIIEVVLLVLSAHKTEMEDTAGSIGLILLLGFIAVFIILILIFKNSWIYLSSPPEIDWTDLTKARDPSEIKQEYEEWSREQNFSSILAGFSVSALAFILAVPDLSSHEIVVEFFSFGFILEMVSFISFKTTVARGFEYLGTLLQFAGLLAFLNGFFIFIFIKFDFSPVVLLAYGIGYAGFFVLSTKHLLVYICTIRHSK